MSDDFNQLRILVVDDERDIRDASERILTRMGFHVRKAKRGDEAIDLLPDDNISIMLLDLKMPGMDGMEVLKHVREQDPKILIIIITGYATVDTAIEAMKRGAYDFIPKPFEPDHLRAVVNRARERLTLTREAKRLEEQRKRTLADLDTEKSRIRTIIESLPDGVVVTNAEGQVVLMNPAFQWHLGLETDIGLGRPIEAYVPDESLCRLVREISSGKHVDYDDLCSIEFSPFSDRYLLAKGQPIIGEKMECLGAVVNIVDITALKTLDRLKSEFVAKVSHELRSPLSTIHEQLAFVLNEMVEEGPKQDLHMLSRAKEKTSGLISLIGDLLDLSRIEAGAVCEEPKPTQVEKLLENIVDFLSPRAKTRSQSLTLQVPNGSLPAVTADPLALESIFGNLITNAINYTQEGGEIKVVVDHTGINLRIRVEDNGFGINEKYQEKIFERFFRVKDEQTRYITGTGLGLPIVKGLVDSLNGLISVESTSGKGSVFTVLLPTAGAADG
jgi:two-component system, OmpR family, phosphate regulon sensor histidine kinase PhoR